MIYLQRHVDLVASWVRGINVDAGYLTNSGANVITERIGDADDKKLVVGVYVSDVELVQSTPKRRDWQFDITVEARVPARLTTAEATVLATLEDLIRCVPSKSEDPNNNIQNLIPTGADISRQPEGTEYIVVSVILRGTCYEFTSPA